MSIGAHSTLIDVAFAVCTRLDAAGERAILTGGSAATFYAPQSYQSRDADFVLRFGADRKLIDAALAPIGFLRGEHGMCEHEHNPFTVEFPPGPLAIGRDVITAWSTEKRDDEVLFLLSPTDCVRDQFLHYYAWGDRTALRAAVAVANMRKADFDERAFRTWAELEHAENRAYDLHRIAEFFTLLNAA